MTLRGERAVKIGLILTTVEDRDGGTTPRWHDIAARAKAAEAAGFGSLWISDHLIHRPDGVPDYGIWECWSIVAALAAVTERAQLGQWVLGAGFRNPALLAKMTDTVDEISGGRAILGIGAGWHEPEYRAFGYPFDNRVPRFEEAIAIIHGLLRSGHVDFEGRFYSARDCELRPRGPRPQGAKIMIGTIGGTPLAERLGVPGTSPKMLRLAAQYADIWNCPWINDPALAPGIYEMVDAACWEVRRDPATLERSHGLMLDLPGFRSQPGNEVTRSGRAAMGSVEGTPLAERLGVPGTSPKMLRLAAQYADIWNCPWINDPALAPGIYEMVDAACWEVQRDPATLERSHGLMLDLPGFRSQPGNEVTRSGRAAMGSVEGTPEQHAELIKQFGAAGTDEVHVHLDPETPETIAEFARAIELVNRG